MIRIRMLRGEFPRERLREANLCDIWFPIFYCVLLRKSL
jgi:hypothetical protein